MDFGLYGHHGKTLLKAKDLHHTYVGKIAGTAESDMGVKETMSSKPSDKQPGDSEPGLQHLSVCHTASTQKARQQGQGPFQPSLSVVQTPAHHTGPLKCGTLAANSE